MEDSFEFYNQEEIEKLIKKQEKLVYVDDGNDEVIVRVEDLPDFIVDINDKTHQRSNLKIYDFHNPSMTPIATTAGFFLDRCKPELRKEIIESLVNLQLGGKIKKYKIIDEDMLKDVREKLISQKVLLEYGDIVEYKGMIAEIEDTNDYNYKEKIVELFNSQEDYNSKNYAEIISLNSINLETNIKDYIDNKYRDNTITGNKIIDEVPIIETSDTRYYRLDWDCPSEDYREVYLALKGKISSNPSMCLFSVSGVGYDWRISENHSFTPISEENFKVNATLKNIVYFFDKDGKYNNLLNYPNEYQKKIDKCLLENGYKLHNKMAIKEHLKSMNNKKRNERSR